MTKIISIIDTLAGGGAEKIAAELTFGIAEKFDHTLITVAVPAGRAYQYEGDIVEMNFAEAQTKPKKLLRQWKIINRLRDLKKERRPSVSISHAAMANFQNILSGTGEKKIIVLHGEFDYKSIGSKPIDYFFRKIYRKADAIVSVSEFIKNDFQRHHKLNTIHQVIYNGVDLSAIRQQATESHQFAIPEKYFVYLAQLRPEKNHFKFLSNIAKTLREHDIKLLLIGEGPERSRIEKFIENNELSSQISLLGRLENPFPVLKTAYASIVASETESFSLAAVESLALGVPVIAADCGGPREILGLKAHDVIDYPHIAGCGIIVPNSVSWNNSTFADEILLLWNDEKMRKDMSLSAIERAEYFTVEKMRQQYINLINSLI